MSSLATLSRRSLEYEAQALARDSLITFNRRMQPDYNPSGFHYTIADTLEAVSRRDLRHVIITVPPQHGKSTLSSIHFPPWHLGHHPNERFILCSYSADLATDFSRKARNLVDDDRWPFPKVRLDQHSKSNTQWNLDGYRGGLRAAGVGGGITGMSANILLIDDPVKNSEQADSELQRDNDWTWFTTTAYTRLSPDGACVLIGTRWHEDDMIGRALNMPHIDWNVLHFPAQALEEGPDALDRNPGEYLWPERYPAEEYESRKRVLGSRGWTTLYQGTPTPPEGETFKRDWWQYYDPEYLPRLRRAIIAVDSSFKDGVTTDYSVFATWGEDYAGNYYLIDLWRERVEFPQLVATGHNIFLKNMHTFAQRSGYGSSFITPMHVEDRASGQSAIQVWTREWHDAAGRRRPGLPVIPFKTKNVSKIARAEGVSPLVEAKRCFLPSEAEWLQAFIDEHASFPAGKHDDQVDTTSMALSVLSERGVITIRGY